MRRDEHIPALPILTMAVAAIFLGAAAEPATDSQTTPEYVIDTDSGAGYCITITYPEVISAFPALEDSLRSFAEDLAEGFLSVVRGEVGGLPECCLGIAYSHEPSPIGLVCIMGSIYEYSGGAHGMYWNTSFIYDELREGFIHPVALLGDSAAFARFAAEVSDSLLSQMGETADTGWILRGTAPSLSNYSAMLPLADEDGAIKGYLVSMCPYQVAPYAMGSWEVIIPERQF